MGYDYYLCIYVLFYTLNCFSYAISYVLIDDLQLQNAKNKKI